ncbi:MAG TPA: class I SAM-dependent methyltransferase [Euzebyales bacterium]|nr:class I SAM-dependent methyltransferase [Euzebyales bacterium]
MLDVGTGSGLVALHAARRGAIVTGVDQIDAWFGVARDAARRAGVDLDLVVGDAEDLPTADGVENEPSSAEWGDPAYLRGRFAEHGVDMTIQRHVIAWRFPSVRGAGGLHPDGIGIVPPDPRGARGAG